MKLLQEFKQFAMRGNVVDMAVGIIIGGAFGKIVSSIVTDVVMPPIGVILGGVDFSSLKIIIKKAVVDAAGKATVPEVAMGYGNFINTVVNFFIIAASIFVVVKLINSLKKKDEAKPAAPPAPTKDQELLSEIRDLLKTKA
jgi:large conductance mechanosensitive channel